jgi:RNA polymerase primary sigma factor
MFNGNYLQVDLNDRAAQTKATRRKRLDYRLQSARELIFSPRRAPGRSVAFSHKPKLDSFDASLSSVAARTSTATDVASALRPRSESDSILSLYMRDAAEVKLLSPAEEVELAARIRAGDEAARERMIRANLRFVVKIAREYEHLGMPLLDLINEGNIGLMRAVEKFDPAKGAKFSSYASLWIKQQIRRALASQGKTIRLPIHVADRIYQLSQAEARFRNVLGRDATDEELAHELGVKVGKISSLRRVALRPASLDAPLAGEDSGSVAEVVADENASTPYEDLLGKTETRLIRKLVDKLPEREAKIIRLRFGLDDSSERTLEEVGSKLNLTRERIRQLQNLAFAKLRRMLEEPSAMPIAA